LRRPPDPAHRALVTDRSAMGRGNSGLRWSELSLSRVDVHQPPSTVLGGGQGARLPDRQGRLHLQIGWSGPLAWMPRATSPTPRSPRTDPRRTATRWPTGSSGGCAAATAASPAGRLACSPELIQGGEFGPASDLLTRRGAVRHGRGEIALRQGLPTRLPDRPPALSARQECGTPAGPCLGRGRSVGRSSRITHPASSPAEATVRHPLEG
jgi:hypothetical protein